MITFERVTKLYGTVIGVNDISLTLEPGVYGLLGPNGSGKTTFINLILGQLRPTLGQVEVFGGIPWMDQGLLNRIGLCPAVQANYPFVNALQWVSYLIELRGYTRSESKRMAIQALEIVDMTHAMHRSMSGYSLGMRQRTVLAQAIAHTPDLLILDEPFNGLDPKGRIEMTAFLKNWVSEGRSLILASHILHEVESLNPSLLLISGGRLLASGTPEQVRSILADCPNALTIQCSDPRAMVNLIGSKFDIGSFHFDLQAGELEIQTRSPIEILEQLPELALKSDIVIYGVRSADGSLQDIFTTLMKIHRGEIRTAV